MATTLTFGKYQGFTMEELATAGKYGRSYLAWCMNNLQNPILRRTAERALLENGHHTDEKALRKLIAVESDYREFTANEIEREVENELAQAEELSKYDSKLYQCEAALRTDLQTMGCSAEVIAFVMANTFDADKIFTQIKFSSLEKQAAFTAAWNKFEDSLPLPGC